ncbi:depupylase/deamidase Dop [Nitrospira moscoviensis]|uniref:Pup deamidase/depupylase n=1 Tax=Nitrospira moscoviensis TaxID=42253 RepID=A0A0K2GGI6_NITMO|nr:depupylase/deamidase Dop [Nitrospira moscoviensis]ALA59944.1 Pup deamidase/depupylase [Nitrospira moscoviensis]
MMQEQAPTSRSRVIGTETEFGIAAKDASAADPVSGSIAVIGHYPRLPAPAAIWDYEHENPLLDARGFEVDGERERPNPDYNRQLNKVLANGGRLYVDGAHPEYSTPECSNAREIVAFERIGERILAQSLEAMTKARGREQYVLYKNNSDGKGNSYGYHENYLVSRSVPFETIVRTLTPFLVTRLIFAGAGKVGAENQTGPAEYQISQRADFFECLVDLNTMVKRPIINTRDEPHADQTKYRRLHVIVGDANMAEVSTYLKVGTLNMVLELLEAGWELPQLELDEPVRAIKQVSRDLDMKETVKLAGGRPTTAIEVQRAYLQAAQRYYGAHPPDPVTQDVLGRWESVLNKLEQDPRLLVRELDWVAKRHLIESYMGRKGCGWDDSRMKLMDLQYHDVRPDKGLFYTLERGDMIDRIVSDQEIERAELTPPPGTRAYFRGRCASKFAQALYGASWTSVLFDGEHATIKKVPLMDPQRGTRALTERLLDSVDTVDALLEKLKA